MSGRRGLVPTGEADTCEVGCRAGGEHEFDGVVWQISWTAGNAVFVVICVCVGWEGRRGQVLAVRVICELRCYYWYE